MLKSALLSALLMVALLPGQRAAFAESPGACPESRAFLEPQLKTRPEDGRFYDTQRRAIQMPIDQVVALMGGIENAYTVATETRRAAESLLESRFNEAERRPLSGSELRHLEDTIVRADALIAILDCRTRREKT
ncbi:MAG: hypothetical protein QNJ94_08455 [Alphaproteobacteria bacterium]|nr:hypothetical protein [Alphaproteobacteria bacterium]